MGAGGGDFAGLRVRVSVAGPRRRVWRYWGYPRCWGGAIRLLVLAEVAGGVGLSWLAGGRYL
jgi:hypothetical protein